MLPRDTPITKQDFDQAGWQALIVGCSEKTTEAYSDALYKEATKAQQAGDLKRTTALALLGDVASPRLQAENVLDPYVASSQASTSQRSALPDDFTADHLAMLR